MKKKCEDKDSTKNLHSQAILEGEKIVKKVKTYLYVVIGEFADK